MTSLYKKLICPALTCLVLLASCSKTLEIEPLTSVSSASFFKTENDVAAFNTGLYIRLRNETSFNSFALGELRGETVAQGLAGTGGYDRYYNNTLDANILTPQITWLSYYTIVNSANLMLKYIPTITFSSPAVRDNYMAQAYTMRAYVYFLMTRTWGDLPLRTEALESYNFEEVQIPRTPQAQIFALIKSDLNEALRLFPTNTIVARKNLWSKPAANALKADVYLWTAKRLGGGNADLQTALDACNAVQTADVGLVPTFAGVFDYGTFTARGSNKGNREVLMAVNYVATESVDNYFSNGYLPTTFSFAATVDPAARAAVGTLGGNNIWSPSALVRNQFTTDDTRRNATFMEINNINATTGAKTLVAAVINKGDGVVDNNTRYFADDIILYRYADVLLLKAEAKNALGQDPATEINVVRQRAYGTAFSAHTFVNGSQVDNDAAILKERLLELAYEGKRWFDLVRFGKAFELVPSLQSRAGQNFLLLHPINAVTLSLEPKVVQNPGYN
jgi:hypothetical protein